MTNETQQMDMFKAVRLFFVNYFDFSGRASRGEFWWAYLAFFIVSIILAIVDVVIGSVVYGFTESEFLLNNGIFTNILSLVTLIGWISLTSRRLQDNGHTGWWQLAYFSIIPTIILWMFFILTADGNPVLLSFSIIFTIITLALYILILVWLILPPTEDENRWGRNPLLD
tara:strand:- start:384 stop:893 length:510 start_codon:yes stop_codon:yes gene_type:complete